MGEKLTEAKDIEEAGKEMKVEPKSRKETNLAPNHLNWKSPAERRPQAPRRTTCTETRPSHRAIIHEAARVQDTAGLWDRIVHRIRCGNRADIGGKRNGRQT